MIAADDILDSLLADDVELEAVNRGQRMAADLVRQLDAAGKPYDITKVEKQLGKVLEGDELQGALAFALATKEYDQQNLSSPNQRELQRAAKEREARAEEQARELDAEITADLEAEAAVEFDFARRLAKPRSQEEALSQMFALQPEPAPEPLELRGEIAPTPVQIDPSDDRFSYRETADGYQVIQEGREPYNVPRGSRAARSIEQVLAGGAPLPRVQAAPAEPAEPTEPIERFSLDYVPGSDSAEALASMGAPAGEAEAPAPKKRLRYNPATGSFE